MKILKILMGNDGGGIFTCETQFIKYWISKGIVVDVVIVGSGKAVEPYKEIASDYQMVDGLDAQYSGGLLRIVKSISSSLKFSRSLNDTIRFKGPYNAVIYRRPVFIHVGGELGRMLNTQVFWHLPNSINRTLGKAYYHFFMDRYEIKPIANSIYTKNKVGKRCKHVIYPGFDKNRIKTSKTSFRTELSIPLDSMVFGIAARINRSKAQDLVVSAMVNSGAFAKDAHLIIAGELSDKLYIEECRRIAGSDADKVHFIGRISDLSKFYSTIDVYVNSRRNEEPFGISIAEALGAGLPVMAYYLGGPSEMIMEGENGWLIEEPNEGAYTSTFKRCLFQRGEWKQMGKSSRAASEKFSASVNAGRFLEIIQGNL